MREVSALGRREPCRPILVDGDLRQNVFDGVGPFSPPYILPRNLRDRALPGCKLLFILVQQVLEASPVVPVAPIVKRRLERGLRREPGEYVASPCQCRGEGRRTHVELETVPEEIGLTGIRPPLRETLHPEGEQFAELDRFEVSGSVVGVPQARGDKERQKRRDFGSTLEQASVWRCPSARSRLTTNSSVRFVRFTKTTSAALLKPSGGSGPREGCHERRAIDPPVLD